jgi:cytochrome c553
MVQILGGALLLVASFTTVAASIAVEELSAALRSKPDLVHGAALFEVCSACHGADGAGMSDGSVPAIAGQYSDYLLKQLVAFRSGNRWDFRMENFSAKHHLPNAQALADVAGHIARLPPPRGAGIGDGVNITRGARVYFSYCTSCHGPRAEGTTKPAATPRLAGQHFEYLLRQLHDAVEHRRPDFPAEHVKLLEPFDKSELEGVSDYLSRLSTAP